MAMKRCPVCGEKYSETYRNCPFCEEELAAKEERPLRHRGQRRGGRREPNILTPLLVIVVLVLALLLAWLFWGDAIKNRLSGGSDPAQSSQVGGQTSTPAASQEPDLHPDDTEPDAPDVPAEPEPLDYETAAALPAGLTLNRQDFTLRAGESFALTVSGGSGNYTWISEDEGVISVDETGRVTAISAGNTHILVTDGASQGTCIARVRGVAATPPATPPANQPAGGSGTTNEPAGTTGDLPTLNREDFTLPVGSQWRLTISGITTAVTWSTENAAVATVSDNGTVTAVGSGVTNITATYDNVTLRCIVRVP